MLIYFSRFEDGMKHKSEANLSFKKSSTFAHTPTHTLDLVLEAMWLLVLFICYAQSKREKNTPERLFSVCSRFKILSPKFITVAFRFGITYRSAFNNMTFLYHMYAHRVEAGPCKLNTEEVPQMMMTMIMNGMVSVVAHHIQPVYSQSIICTQWQWHYLNRCAHQFAVQLFVIAFLVINKRCLTHAHAQKTEKSSRREIKQQHQIK